MKNGNLLTNVVETYCSDAYEKGKGSFFSSGKYFLFLGQSDESGIFCKVLSSDCKVYWIAQDDIADV